MESFPGVNFGEVRVAANLRRGAHGIGVWP
jgi:hypothetical protein